MKILNMILLFVAGLGTFLLGIGSLGGNLEAVAGSKLRKMFNKISNNRLAGVGIGAGVTAIIQSSSATTVMVVGFVNAGIMTLMQATPIIMGANIGTTITAFIVSMQSLPITLFFACLSCVGAFMLMSSKQNVKKVGAILANLGLLFIGLEVMSDAMADIKEYEQFRNFIASLSNPFLLLLFGIILTAVIQSSSAMTGILIILIGQDLVTMNSAIFMVLGINIGTCITALLATIGTTTNAKRTAFIHFTFNTIGALIFFIPQFITTQVQAFGAPHVGCFDQMLSFIKNPEFELSIFHLIFNISTTILLLPLTKQLVKLSELVVRDKKKKIKSVDDDEFVENKLTYIDERILETPAIAVNQITKEIAYMASLAKKNLDLSYECMVSKNLEKQPIFDKREKQINFMNKELAKYLVKISTSDISYRDELKIASYYHVISDIERIGDYAENITEYTASMLEDNLTFSDDAMQDIKDLYDRVCDVYDNAISAFEEKDLALLAETEKCEDEVDDFQRIISDRHLARLYKASCTSANGAIFISLVNNLERIADHMTNIAHSIKDYTKESVKTTPIVKATK